MTLQLHPACLFWGVRICLLWNDVINFMFPVELQLIFMVLLFNIFDNGFDLGKYFFSNLKNNFTMLVFTLKEKGALNHMIFLLLLLFPSFRVCSSLSLFLYFNSSLKPLLRSASSYVVFAVYPDYMKYVIRLLIALSRSFKIFGGWFDCLLM